MIREQLLQHMARYPEMEIQDMVKLLYQSEFGGGHMIADPKESLGRLREEYVQTQVGEQKSPLLYEKIGNGLCRLYLSALSDGLRVETMNEMFVKTANRTVGETEAFEKQLKLFAACCETGELAYSPKEVEQYLEEYKKQGYPAVSHSEAYRRRYHPAYRVVSERYIRYYDVFLQIDRLLAQSEKEPLLAAVDGKSGSGKSTLGKLLAEIYDCRLFHMDDFFLRPDQRTKERLAAPGGNVDYERFQLEILDRVSDKNGLEYQVYDCSAGCLGAAVTAPYRRLNLVEGVYSQHPYFGDIYDLRFFGEISSEEQVQRIRERNGEFMLERFKNEWIPMENRYFETYKIKQNSILL